MRQYLSIFLAFISTYHCYATMELPPYLQNKKWVEVVEYKGVYYNDGTNVLFETDIDSINYINNEVNVKGDKWAVEALEITENGVKLFCDKGDNNFYHDLTWQNEERTIMLWHSPYNLEDYRSASDFYLVDSAFLHLLPDYQYLVVDTLNITDVIDAVRYMRANIEDIIEELSQDYNEDGIMDKIVSYKEWAYEDDINHSHRYYYTLFFLGNGDGTFRSAGHIYKEIQKPGMLRGVSGKGNKCCFTISNLVDEATYDPFTNLDATLADFDEGRVKTVTEIYSYNIGKKQWELEATKVLPNISKTDVQNSEK